MDPIINTLVHNYMLKYPLPWSTGQDWSLEILTTRGDIVMKCNNSTEAKEIIRLAKEIQKKLDDLELQLEAQDVMDAILDPL